MMDSLEILVHNTEIHTGLERHESEYIIVHFWMNYPFVCSSDSMLSLVLWPPTARVFYSSEHGGLFI